MYGSQSSATRRQRNNAGLRDAEDCDPYKGFKISTVDSHIHKYKARRGHRALQMLLKIPVESRSAYPHYAQPGS